MNAKETSISWETQIAETFGTATEMTGIMAQKADPILQLARHIWQREVVTPAISLAAEKADRVRQRTKQFFRR